MFPFVTCEFTGSERPGYAICGHVIHGAAIAEITPASDDEMGTVCCMVCAAIGQGVDPARINERDFSLVCADCTEMNFGFGLKVGSA
jgi:hypothetical protein